MLAALVAVSLALTPLPRGGGEPAAAGEESHVEMDMGSETGAKGQESRRETAAPQAGAMPRYYPAPLTDAQWQRLAGQRVLVIFGAAGRECVTLVRVERDAIHYEHPTHGPKQAPVRAVTAVHENSWECAPGRESTPSEWARVGAGLGLGFSAVGMLMGVLYDAGRAGKDSGDGFIKHFMYTGIGLTTTLIGPPIVAVGGASTRRDLRVHGRIWARGLGYAFYAGAAIMGVLYLVGQYGEKEPLQFVGITSLTGGLGLAGSAFLAVDALGSRAELKRLERQDSGRAARRGELRLGALPLRHGLGVGFGGRF